MVARGCVNFYRGSGHDGKYLPENELRIALPSLNPIAGVAQALEIRNKPGGFLHTALIFSLTCGHYSSE